MPRTNRPKYSVQICGYDRIKAFIYKDGGRNYLAGCLVATDAPAIADLRKAGRDPHVQRAATRGAEAVRGVLIERHPGVDRPGVADFLADTLQQYLHRVAVAVTGRPRLTVGELVETHREDTKPDKAAFHRAVVQLAGGIPADELNATDVSRLIGRAGQGGWMLQTDRPAKPWAEPSIRKLLGVLVDAYRYGAAHGLLEIEAAQRIEYAAGLPLPEWIGKPGGKDAVPDAIVDATRKHLANREAQDLLDLQRLTGARPGELCALRAEHLDRTGEVWIYSPDDHKTAKRGKRRSIFFGPRAQAILGPRLDCRKPFKLSPDQYRERIHAAARRAGVEQWGPNQIRHTVSNAVKQQFGRDAEAVFLGHGADVAEEHYLETELPLGVKIAKEIG